MVKKHTVEGGQATAAAILDAADALFGGVGYEGLSMRAVADRAGVNKALVYYHFRNKAQLFERVLERYYTAHLEALKGALDEGEGDVARRFHRLIDAYFDFIDSHRGYPRLIQQQVASGSTGPHIELIQRNLEPLFRWTESALAGLTPAHGPLAARHFFISFSGMVINYFTYGHVMAALWGTDPLSPEAVSERRVHLHWMLDTILTPLDVLKEAGEFRAR